MSNLSVVSVLLSGLKAEHIVTGHRFGLHGHSDASHAKCNCVLDKSMLTNHCQTASHVLYATFATLGMPDLEAGSRTREGQGNVKP